MNHPSQRALVLGGGGARGAYQTGVVRALGEIARESGEARPFGILCGLSAGAVNAAYLAARPASLHRTSKDLMNFWSSLDSEKVYRIDTGSLSRIGFDWALDLLLGGLKQSVAVKALLDTRPLRELLAGVLDVQKIRTAVEAGLIDSVGITASCYATQRSVTFVETGRPGALANHTEGPRPMKLTSVNRDHVMASAAIPIFFPPVLLDGQYFGDGAVKNAAPLSPAIRMGATSLCVVGVHRATGEAPVSGSARPTAARILGSLLDTLFLDSLDADVERLDHVNRILEATATSPAAHGQRVIPHLYLLPSEDPGGLALQHVQSAPRTIRYLIRGLGSEEESASLLSYLLFEGPYLSALADLGYRDTWDRKDQVRTLLATPERDAKSNRTRVRSLA